MLRVLQAGTQRPVAGVLSHQSVHCVALVLADMQQLHSRGGRGRQQTAPPGRTKEAKADDAVRPAQQRDLPPPPPPLAERLWAGRRVRVVGVRMPGRTPGARDRFRGLLGV